jgi:chorismate mutase
MEIQAVRGATGVRENSKAAISDAVQTLMEALLRRNALSQEQLISVQFTLTADLTAYNPASAFREMGYASVPLLCAREPEIEGAMPGVVRVLVTAKTPTAARLIPMYRGGAERLRPDLAGDA